MDRTEQCKCGGQKRKGYSQCRKCFLDYYKTRTTKLCRKCNRELPLDYFRKRHSETRPRSACRDCEAAYAKSCRDKLSPEEKRQKKRDYYKNNPEKSRRQKNRWGWKRMGLDPDVVEKYINNRPNICEICGGPPNGRGALAVDHCHEKNIFRGILCSKCNTGLGMYEDNPALLRKAAEYLETHAHKTSALGAATQLNTAGNC